MSQPPEQPPLAAASSYASITSTIRTPTPDHNSLTTPPPRTLSHTLTPSLPPGVPSPLTYTPSIGDATASPTLSISDSLYSPHPHPRSSSFPPPSSTYASLPQSQPSRALAAAGQQRLAAVLSGVHGLLASYQQLSAVDSTTLQSSSSNRSQSDAHDHQTAATAQRQRAEVESALAALQSIVGVLVERETVKQQQDDGMEEERIRQLTARRDHLLQLVSDGNADMLQLIGRLRSLHRSLGMFAYEHDAELRIVPLTEPATQQPANNVRR